MGVSFALPECEGSPTEDKSVWGQWHKCVGTYFNKANGVHLISEFKDGKMHGQGTTSYSPSSKWAGQKHVGEYRDDKRSGQGTLTFANGKI